ncbi:hypothetical protein [Selenomonas sp. TAMA-11512]|uniref:hypothetical protein n=1 Tax=Selenomonas sp. TAMA-11512 TaxID=3095337 RepID=UPI0030D23A29
MTESDLKAGVIFGDRATDEYVYMPASEIGVKVPVCVYEAPGLRDDIDFAEALRLIRVRSLRPTTHPRLGKTSC